MSDSTPRTLSCVGGDGVRPEEALAQRVQRAGADVAVDDAERGQRERGQGTRGRIRQLLTAIRTGETPRRGPPRRAPSPPAQVVAVLPLQLGHDGEVHAVDAGDHGRHRDHRRPGGDALHVLVLRHRHQRQVGLERGGQQLALRVDRLVEPHHVIVDVAEVRARVLRDVRQVEPHQPVAHLDQRRHGAAQGQRVAFETVDLAVASLLVGSPSTTSSSSSTSSSSRWTIGRY